MYCKVFTSQQVYGEMTEMTIACDNVFVTDGWICLYKDEKFVASFDMVTINGWVLIDSTADTPQKKQSNSEYYLELADAVMRGEMSDASANQAWYEYINKQDTPQTDCGWGEPITVSHNEERKD